MAFVLDNSVAMGWFIPSQATPYSERALDRAKREALHAPAIWPLEFVNVILVLERRRKLAFADGADIVSRMERLGVTVDGGARGPAIRELARRHGLSAYDAAYLELAERLDLPLAAADGPLREAATRGNRLLQV